MLSQCNDDIKAKIKRAKLLQELRERQTYCNREFTVDEMLDLILQIRNMLVPPDIGIYRRR